MKRLLRAVILGSTIGASGIAVASEPVKLDGAQMDRVTAGRLIDTTALTNPALLALLNALGLVSPSPSPFGTLTVTTPSSNVTVTTAPGSVNVTASVHSGS